MTKAGLRRRAALSSVYVHPGGLNGRVSSKIIAIVLVTVPMLFGGKALDILGADVATTSAVWGTVAASGAVGGAIYHPIQRFWWRGALAGIVAAIGAFAAHRAYVTIRPNPFGIEFAVIAMLGAVPGLVLYNRLMRGQYVVWRRVTPEAKRRRT